MNETLYDRDNFKLIDRICSLRKTNPNIKVSEIIQNESDIFQVEVYD